MATEVGTNTAYDILGVAKGANVPAIRKAFRKLMLRHHPDAVAPEEKAAAQEYCARINQAYELLCNANTRKNYDALLAKGIVPDLSQQVGDLPLPGLADIIGDIHALNLKTNQKKLLSGMNKDMRKMVTEALVSGVEVNESVIDAIRVDELPLAAGFNRPPGDFDRGWVVVTELRIIVVMQFIHRWTKGNTKYTQVHWRANYFWYPSLTNMEVHEIGRAFASYELELADEHGTRFVMALRAPRLTRLFLVANTYKLPLKIKTAPVNDRARRNEIWATVGQTMILPFAFAIPFACYSLWVPLNYICGKDKDAELAPFAEYGSIFEFMTACGLTTLVLYVTPFLAIYLGTRVYLAWRVGWTHEILGELKLDYARGGPASPPVEMAVSDGALPKVPAVRHEQDVEQPPADTTPVDVQLPDAVREARKRSS